MPPLIPEMPGATATAHPGLAARNFLPMRESESGAITLPGLGGDPHPQVIFPIGTYPIPASGENTGTLYPLAEPLIPRIPEPGLVAQPVQLPLSMPTLPQVEMAPPTLLPIPQVEVAGPGEGLLLPDLAYQVPVIPGIQSLGSPLPTEVSPVLPAMPPGLIPPTYAEYPQLPGSLGAASELRPDLSGQETLSRLAATLSASTGHLQRGAEVQAQKGALRIPLAQDLIAAARGKLAWNDVWGGDWGSHYGG